MLAPPPLALLEVEFEVSLDAIGAGETAFGVRPEALNAIDVNLAVSKRTALLAVFLDPQVLVITDIDQPVISFPAIGHQHALKADLASDHILQSLGFYVWHDLG